MNIAIVYDSVFGNTAQIAVAMAGRLKAGHDVVATTVQDASGLDLSRLDLLIIGSPTRGFRATPQVSDYLEGLEHIPPGMAGAAFDTRLDLDTVHPAPLRWIMDVGGYAATRLEASMKDMGMHVPFPAGGFYVLGAEGPLKEGELERAQAWAIDVASRLEVTAGTDSPRA